MKIQIYMEWQETFKDIEDKLIPYFNLDIWERGLYYYLLGQSRIRGFDSITIALSKIASDLRISDTKSRETIRFLAEKGCIELEQTRKGHFVKVLLPNELNLPQQLQENQLIDIETIDFCNYSV
jgi:hypothetical protein